MFLFGLLLLAIASILVAIAIWRSGKYPKWIGIPFAFGMTLYAPQFFGEQSLRVAHGLLVAIGCICIGVVLLKHSNQIKNQKTQLKREITSH